METMETFWIILTIIGVATTISSSSIEHLPIDNLNIDINENPITIRRIKREESVDLVKNKLIDKVPEFNRNRQLPLSLLGRDIGSVEIDFKVKDLSTKEFINKTEKLNRRLIHTSENYIYNRDTTKQRGQSITFSQKYTKTDTVQISKTRDISGDIKIPLVDGYKLNVKFTETKTTWEVKSEEVQIQAPSQPIDVNPLSKIKVIFKLYTFEDIYRYLVDFELDSSSNMKIKYRAKTYSFGYDFWPPTEDVGLLTFLSNYKDYVNSIEYANDDDVKLAYENDRFVMKNFPMEERVLKSELRVEFGEQESL